MSGHRSAGNLVANGEVHMDIEELSTVLSMRNELQPRMLVSMGCSGSSEGLRITKDLLSRHGLPVAHARDGKSELFRCGGNPYCLGDNSISSYDDRLTTAVQTMVAESAQQNASLVFKGSNAGIHSPVWAIMHQLHTRAAVAWRENSLARLVCTMRDCFNPLAPSEGTLVGPNTDACFKRRELPFEQQPRVWLNTSSLVSILRTMKREDWVSLVEPLKQNGWAESDFVVQKTEDLLAHQTTTTRAALEVSVDAWSEVLRSLGVNPDRQIVRSALEEKRGAHPSLPLSAMIENADEVQALLAAEGAPYDEWMPNPMKNFMDMPAWTLSPIAMPARNEQQQQRQAARARSATLSVAPGAGFLYETFGR